MQPENTHLDSTRGQMKIFLGYAAGVGKTYAMLAAAQQQYKEGVDLAVAVVDSHGRKETEELMKNLPTIPLKKIEYRGTTLQEMDIDAILKRHPQLAIVDELAHTNAPGSRHPKRYQDVEELLAAGINVYTTLNIQHIESLHDAIAQITGVTVRERLPDDVLEKADEIVLIDLPPEELLKRLREGKVYAPHQASRAMQRFFKPENLTALREITLRSATERISQDMREQIEVSGIIGPWPSGERVLTCIGTSPVNEKLIRTSRRVAKSLKAEWLAIFVETPQTLNLPRADRDRLALNLKLANELGAKTVTIPGNDVASEIIEYALKHNITKILIGKPQASGIRSFFKGSLVDILVRNIGSIDVYVINTLTEKPDQAVMTISATPKKEFSWAPYVLSFLLVVLITLIGIPISWYLQLINIAMLYLGAVVIAAIYFGFYPSAFVALLGVLSLNFFFIERKFTFRLEDTQYLITLGAMLVLGMVISKLTSSLKEQVDKSQRRQKEVIGLYELSRDLASAHNLEAVCRTILEYVQTIFQSEGAILISDGHELEVYMHTPGFEPDENEMAVAAWAFKNNKPAGFRTDTLSGAAAYHQPLETSEKPVGILAIKPVNREYIPTPDDYRVLEGVAHLAATNIERALLSAPKKLRKKI